MSHLRVLKDLPPQPAPPDYPAIYQRAIHRKLTTATDRANRGWLFQAVYLTVKGLPIMFGDEIHRGFSNKARPEESELKTMLDLIFYSKGLLSQLTPRELIRIFPVTKSYDGDRYGCKDYFFTIEALKEIGMDTAIGDEIDNLFFDYQNRHVTRFILFELGVCSDLRRCQGQPGIMEQFMEQHGFYPLRMMTDDTGKQFFYDPVKHTTMPVKKKRPRYLRLVKKA